MDRHFAYHQSFNDRVQELCSTFPFYGEARAREIAERELEPNWIDQLDFEP